MHSQTYSGADEEGLQFRELTLTGYRAVTGPCVSTIRAMIGTATATVIGREQPRQVVEEQVAGRSTFDYLSTYRVNRIKISQPLIDATTNDADSAATMRAIVAMASELRIDVIAQGQGTSSSRMPGCQRETS